VSQAADARVLLVEDDPELMEFVRFMLEQEKYQVITANNGEDGLNKARAERPDLVLLDVLLPKIHGFEVCERLRQDPATCLIPIIMVTSLTAIKDRLTGIKLGADEYISKPFEPVELLARVENLILRTRQNVAANPLTGLAGGVILEQEIKRRLHDGVDFSLGWGDATHLADVNDLYGFERGDGVIRLLGTILRSAVVELGNRSDLAVHLGGDDFAYISSPARAEVIGARVLENVDSLIPMQYDQASRERGFAVRKDSAGNEVQKPFLSFSIGLVDVLPGLYQHHAQVWDRAKTALAEAKKKGANQLVKLS
jgi:diguanylate cyclase (GGDEF)-like protein